MESLVEFTPTPPQFWPEAAAQEESDRNRSDAFIQRYEVLLRLSRCLTLARPEDLVNSIAAELRMVVDFDLLDIVVNQTNASEVNPVPCGDWFFFVRFFAEYIPMRWFFLYLDTGRKPTFHENNTSRSRLRSRNSLICDSWNVRSKSAREDTG